MTPKAKRESAPASAPLLEQRVAYERAWAYDAWMARLSWGAMRRLANAQPEAGGLGYDLSEQACKGLVEQARTDRGDLTMGRAERLERQAAEVDERARSARHDFGAAYTKAAALDEAIAALRASDERHVDVANYVARLSKLVDQRDRHAAELERADNRLDRIHAREARLFGLDAPTEAKLEVTSRDAVTDELNAMLERAARKPVREDAGQ